MVDLWLFRQKILKKNKHTHTKCVINAIISCLGTLTTPIHHNTLQFSLVLTSVPIFVSWVKPSKKMQVGENKNNVQEQ